MLIQINKQINTYFYVTSTPFNHGDNVEFIKYIVCYENLSACQFAESIRIHHKNASKKYRMKLFPCHWIVGVIFIMNQ